MFPLGPVMDGMGLNITIMSYLGSSTGGGLRRPRRAPVVGHCRGHTPGLTDLMEAAGLAPEPFEVPLHLGPGMPATAHWHRSGATAPGDGTGTAPA